MENFKLWIFALGGATAVTSLFKILLSNSSINKVLNIFFSVFILFYMVMPLQTFTNDFSLTKHNSQSVEFDEIYKNGYEEIIKISIKNICTQINVEVISLKISSYLNDDGYLCVEQLIVDISDDDKKELVKVKIKEKLSYEATVI
ncbi:MAG: hypothetical protein IKW45_03265 [Clostridia bacterium]|nr:hypothetical protein [Clostridia bacterium]